ncbi:MAG: glutamate 5-kinase [Lachnospiraceae bacterium]|nr:glutamate 5-kinase [Lachnospiraceae bacterium]
MSRVREQLSRKNRIVVKIGSSSLVHGDTGRLDYVKLEKLVRFLCDLRNQGKDVILVSSGAIGVGAMTLGLPNRPKTTSLKQACAAVGQGQLMMVYQKLFSEYHQTSAQVLLTFDVITSEERRRNAINTFNELLQIGIIPVVNENDTVATEELEFGDNDTLSAIVVALVKADCLVIMSDIDGLYTDDPHYDPNASLISEVPEITEALWTMAKGTATSLGTGGMTTKLKAASIATAVGADMAILNGERIEILQELFMGEDVGTVFHAHPELHFQLEEYVKKLDDV